MPRWHRVAGVRMLATLLVVVASLAAPAAGAEYRLGAGDRISVVVAGSPEFDTRGRIREDGSVGIPHLGAVAVGGMTLPEAEAALERRLRSAQLLRAPQVTITVEEYLSRQVTVLGEVREPGRYGLSGPVTLAEMLAQAGGVREEGADHLFVVRREDGEPQRYRVEMADITSGRYADILLQAGDIVTVPRMSVFYIEGAVSRAGMYRFEEGMTVMQAVAVGGGLTPRGSYGRIEIRRKDGDGRMRVIDAELDDPLRAGDVVRVKERIF